MLREHLEDAAFLAAARNLARLIERLSLEKDAKLTTDPTGNATGLYTLLHWVFSERGSKVLEDEPSIKETLSEVCVMED